MLSWDNQRVSYITQFWLPQVTRMACHFSPKNLGGLASLVSEDAASVLPWERHQWVCHCAATGGPPVSVLLCWDGSATSEHLTLLYWRLASLALQFLQFHVNGLDDRWEERGEGPWLFGTRKSCITRWLTPSCYGAFCGDPWSQSWDCSWSYRKFSMRTATSSRNYEASKGKNSSYTFTTRHSRGIKTQVITRFIIRKKVMTCDQGRAAQRIQPWLSDTALDSGCPSTPQEQNYQPPTRRAVVHGKASSTGRREYKFWSHILHHIYPGNPQIYHNTQKIGGISQCANRREAVSALDNRRGASLVAEWLSSPALLRQPRVSPVQILGAVMAPLIRPCWGGVPHSTTRGTHNYNLQLCTGGLWGEGEGKKEEEDRQQLLAQVPIFKKEKKNEAHLKNSN